MKSHLEASIEMPITKIQFLQDYQITVESLLPARVISRFVILFVRRFTSYLGMARYIPWRARVTEGVGRIDVCQGSGLAHPAHRLTAPCHVKSRKAGRATSRDTVAVDTLA